MAPKGMTRVFFTSGGSEANESMIRLSAPLLAAARAPGQASRSSPCSAPTTARRPAPPASRADPVPPVLRAAAAGRGPHRQRLLLPLRARARLPSLRRRLRRRVGAGRRARGRGHDRGVDRRTGTGGRRRDRAAAGYFERIREICDRHDILFVADEVITGFGRWGSSSPSQRWKVTPDLIVFAKGVTSGYLPLGGVLLREEIFATILEQGPGFLLHHGFTYSGHPVVCTAGLENLRILAEEKLIERVARLAPYFAQRLEALRRHPIVGDVRHAGMMGAVELVRDRATRAARPSPTSGCSPRPT
jgi:adenosylmethionine-8-amino-7-oxononanoate aminotransferase